MKKVAIIQSSYLPWKGYFDIIHDVDTFIFLDCVQFTKRDWRNRNYIKTPSGLQLITVPVAGTTNLPINQIKIDQSQDWEKKHKLSFQRNYAKAKYFSENKDILDQIFDKKWTLLSELNQETIKIISRCLKIKTDFIDSRSLDLAGSKSDRLIDAVKKVGGDIYISGPSAKDYIEKEKFHDVGIKLQFKEYEYPVYEQLWGEFSHNVSILDLIFNYGNEATDYIWRK